MGLREAIKLYKSTPFIITEIHSDNEFKSAVTHPKNNNNQQIVVNFSNPQGHVPATERNNRTIKDRCRSIYHSLPYNRMTKWMIIYLVLSTIVKLNYFPSRNSQSKYYSPRTLLHRRSLELNKHYKFSFGK